MSSEREEEDERGAPKRRVRRGWRCWRIKEGVGGGGDDVDVGGEK
jgi:hypothetical protein